MLKNIRKRLVAASPKTIWIGLGGVLAIAVGVSAMRARHEVAATDSKLLVGRIWIDHLPKSDTDHFEVFAAVSEGSMGVFQRSSAYEGAFEVFKYEPRGDGKLQMLFPQSRKKYDVKYDAKTCDEGGFDYCLGLTGAPRGAQRYVSKKGWEIEAESTEELERKLEAFEHEHAGASE